MATPNTFVRFIYVESLVPSFYWEVMSILDVKKQFFGCSRRMDPLSTSILLFCVCIFLLRNWKNWCWEILISDNCCFLLFSSCCFDGDCGCEVLYFIFVCVPVLSFDLMVGDYLFLLFFCMWLTSLAWSFSSSPFIDKYYINLIFVLIYFYGASSFLHILLLKIFLGTVILTVMWSLRTYRQSIQALLTLNIYMGSQLFFFLIGLILYVTLSSSPITIFILYSILFIIC